MNVAYKYQFVFFTFSLQCVTGFRINDGVMVRANHLDSPQSSSEVTNHIDNGCTIGAHTHVRNASSSASSAGSSSTTPLVDWGSMSFSSTSSLNGQSLQGDFPYGKNPQWSTQEDLIHSYTSNPTSSSASEVDDEQIKLLCGEDLDGWPAGTNGQWSLQPPPHPLANNRRRKFIPKLPKVLQKVRRRFNWQLLLALVVLFAMGLSMSRYNDYQFSSGKRWWHRFGIM